jgi:hypothetical protein
VGQRQTDQPEEPPVRKSFLEEAFEHRQSGVLPDADDVEAVESEEPDESEIELEPSDAEPEFAAGPIHPPLEIGDYALVDEALKKSGLIWIRTASSPGGRAVWHAWIDGCVYLVTGGDEQPDPGLDSAGETTIVIRSKETTSRLVTLEATVELLTAAAPDWDSATAELAKIRLNLYDSSGAAARWRSDPAYRLYRLRPVGPLVEGPGAYLRESHRAAPVATTATTAGAKPKVLHRRHGSGAPLS